MNTPLRRARSSPAITVHAATRQLTYVAQWHEYDVCDEAGTVLATISATAYVVSEPGRAVTFLWNGGPGASSSPLHMNALGPRLLRDGVPQENPDTILDASDLVFIDPVGTGLSRLIADDAEERLLNVPADAAAVAGLIRQWLTEHDRLDADVHLVGESYGGFRLAELSPLIADLNVHSIALISPALDTASVAEVPGNILPAVLALPTMATTAWRHGRSSAFACDDHTVAAVWDAAEEFAADTLLPALYRGSALPDAERARLAQRLHELTGLSIDLIVDKRLAVDSETFLRALRADDELLVGRLDTRVTGPVPPPRTDDKPGAVDDPALGIGASFVMGSAPIGTYLHEELGVPGDEEYISLSLQLNFAWDWRQQQKWPAEPYQSAVPSLRKFLTERPDVRVLLIGGYYDMACTLASTVRAVRQAADDVRLLEIVRLDAGHSIDDAVRAEAAAALRRTIRPDVFTPERGDLA